MARDWVDKVKEQFQAAAALKFAHSVNSRDNLTWLRSRPCRGWRASAALDVGTGETYRPHLLSESAPAILCQQHRKLDNTTRPATMATELTYVVRCREDSRQMLIAK
jgi:hypothetical protein